MAKVIKIAIYQGLHGIGVPDEIVNEIKPHKVDLLGLPEYFFVQPDEHSILPSAKRHDTHLRYLMDLSLKLNCAIAGGTLLIREGERYKNRCYLISRGSILGSYDKIHPYKNEGKGLVEPGKEFKVFGWNGIKLGILICADVLFESSFAGAGGLDPDLLIVPVTSPYREGESAEEKFERDKILFVRGAQIAGCPIVKIGSVGKIAGRRLQGRSLVATRKGIIFRVPPEDEARPMLKIIEVTI